MLQENPLKFFVCVPTYNGGNLWRSAAQALKNEVLETKARVLVIDSGSTDGTDVIAEESGFTVQRIRKEDFDHGATRQHSLDFAKDESVVVFITQDSILQPGAINELLKAFKEKNVMMGYGRQLPRKKSKPIEAHARLFNYTDRSEIKSLASIPILGIKTPFCSNSFSAYRIGALREIGGFPKGLIFGEDMYVSAKLILNGYSTAYVASATCEHSHNYTILQDFKRSFDIGVFHNLEPWIIENFGSASNEGFRYLKSEIHFVGKKNKLLLISVALRTCMKYLGYKLGRKHQALGVSVKKWFGMNTTYWTGSKKFTTNTLRE